MVRRVVRQLPGRAADRAAPRPDRDRHRGRLARARAGAEARRRLRRARRQGAVRDAVRARRAPHARQHQLGRRTLRGVRAPMGAGRGGGVRRRARQPHDVRARRDAAPSPGRRHLLTHPGEPAARAALPRPGHRPGAPLVPARDRARGRRRGGRPGGLRPEPARSAGGRARGRAAGAGGRWDGVRRGGQARGGRLRRRRRPAVRAARRPDRGRGIRRRSRPRVPSVVDLLERPLGE